ncbi:hypothetical protein ATANTOWER_011070 [Ataeniobius toweri]|uniref:Uncharacterized protein n=1 Tax=Ataeniobius toweri TaxID=208326 RepID=A0ABU7API8_9TELE|nr:hypothetical protein [Ataeniobius toweri]
MKTVLNLNYTPFVTEEQHKTQPEWARQMAPQKEGKKQEFRRTARWSSRGGTEFSRMAKRKPWRSEAQVPWRTTAAIQEPWRTMTATQEPWRPTAVTQEPWRVEGWNL